MASRPLASTPLVTALLAGLCGGCLEGALLEPPPEADPCPGGLLQSDQSCAACGLDSCPVRSGGACGLLPDPCGAQVECPCPDDEGCGEDGRCVPVEHCAAVACLAPGDDGELCLGACSSWERVESIYVGGDPEQPQPDRRVAAALAYLPSLSGPGALVLIGGTQAAVTGWLSLDDSWVITAEPDPSPDCERPCVRWTRSTAPGPTPRSAARMVAACGAVWLFGGEYVGTPIGLGEEGQPLDDLWRWDGEQWEELPRTEPWPSARSVHLFGYDQARSELVLFGSEAGDLATWTAPCPERGGSAHWTSHPETEATPLTWSPLAHAWDPNLGPEGELRVYGYGSHAAWTGTGWRALEAKEPGPLRQAVMAFEPVPPPGRMVLHGGNLPDGEQAGRGIGATWEAIGEGSWTPRATPGSARPAAWSSAAIVYFPELEGLFLTAGMNTTVPAGSSYLLGPPLR